MLARLDRALAECDARAGFLIREQQQLAVHRANLIHQRNALLGEITRRAAVAEQARRAQAERDRQVRAEQERQARAQWERHAQADSVRPPTPQPAPGPADLAAALPPRRRRLETSRLSVQHVLLALGGLLLCVAAVTFAFVAWTEYGLVGQSLILATGTALALAVPVVLARRGLTATAESISAVALLLVGLDALATRAFGLFGVDRWVSGPTHAGLTMLGLAVAALGYRALTGLVTPRYVALLAAQPVVPLLVLGQLNDPGRHAETPAALALADLFGHTVAGWVVAALLVAVAAQNLVVIARFAVTGSAPPALRVTTWCLHGLALLGSLAFALSALATAETRPDIGLAAATTLVASAVVIVSAECSQISASRTLGAGAVAAVMVYAVFRVVYMFKADVAVVAVAGAVLLVCVATRLSPQPWRRGLFAVSAVSLGCTAVGVVFVWFVATGRAIVGSFPAWQPAGASVAAIGGMDWRPAAIAVLVTVGAAMTLVGEQRHMVLLAGTAVLATGGPVWLVPFWMARPLVAGAAAFALGAATLTCSGPAGRSRKRAAVTAGLLVYAAVMAMPVAWISAAVLGTLITGCALIALIGYRRGNNCAWAASAAVGAGLAGLPPTTAACLAATGVTAELVLAGAAVAAVLVMAGGRLGRAEPASAVGASIGALATAVIGGWAVLAEGPAAVDERTIGQMRLSWFAGAGSAMLVIVGAVLVLASVRHRRPATGQVDAAAGTLASTGTLVSAGTFASAGVASAAVTLAGIGSVARLVALLVPGSGIIAFAALTGLAALAAKARCRLVSGTGALIAGLAIGTGCALIAVVQAGASAAAAFVQRPWAADPASWRRFADAVDVFGWQVPAALALLALSSLTVTARYRAKACLGAAALCLLAAPAAVGLPWWAAALISIAAAAVLAGVAAMTIDRAVGRAAGVVALVLAAHATAASLARPVTTGCVLSVITVLGGMLGTFSHRRAGRPQPQQPQRKQLPTQPETQRRAPAARFADIAFGCSLGTAAGAVASWLVVAQAPVTTVVAITAATGSACLAIGSAIRLLRDSELPALIAAGGVAIVSAACWVAGSAAPAERAMLAALVLAAATRAVPRVRAVGGAAGAAAALTVSLARLAALAVPGVPLVTTAATVLLVAVAVSRVPPVLRRGSASAVGACLAGTAGVAVTLAGDDLLRSFGAALPAWSGDVAALPVRPAMDQGWQVPAVLIMAAVAALALRDAPVLKGWSRSAAWDIAAAAMAFAAIETPVSLELPWWASVAMPGLVAFVCGVGAVVPSSGRAVARLAVAAAAIGGCATAIALISPAATAAALGGLVLCGALVAVLLRRADQVGRVVGSAAVWVCLVALPAMSAALAMAHGWATDGVLRGALLALLFATIGVAMVRRARPRYLTAAVGAVTVAGAVLALASGPTTEPTGVYAAAAAVLGVCAGLLSVGRPSSADSPGSSALDRDSRRHGGLTVMAAAGPQLLIAAAWVLPGVLASLLAPYGWLVVGWGPAPAGSAAGLSPGNLLAPGSRWDPVVLLIGGLAGGLAAAGLHAYRRGVTSDGPDRPVAGVTPHGPDRPSQGSSAAALWRAALAGASVGFGLAALVAPATLDAPWPCGPAVALALAIGSGMVAVRRPAASTAGGRVITAATALFCAATGAAALCGSLATVRTTLAALGLTVGAAVLAAVVGRQRAGRVVAWLSAGTTGVLLAVAGSTAADLAADRACLVVGAVAMSLLVAAAVLPAAQRIETVVVECLSYTTAAFAVLVALTENLWTAAVCLVGYGAALGLSALRRSRRSLVGPALGCELVAWWLFLLGGQVGVPEAYTLPVAVTALVGGALWLRSHPHLRSWFAYGPALAATFLPSVVLLLIGGAHPMRRLGLGIAALVVLLAGGSRRRQAPVVVAAGVLVFLAGFELVRSWDLLPRWLPIAVGGLILVLVGATYERRRRDVRRLRGVLSKLS